jgi:hypothetical protein
MRSEPLQTRLSQAGGGQRGYVKSIERGKVGLGVSEWLLTGTRPNGDSVRVRGCDHWEFRGGKVTRKDSYWKMVEKPT